MFLQCSVRFQKISILYPRVIIGNSDEKGILKTKISKGTYDPKLEIPEHGRVQTQKPSLREYEYFWNFTVFSFITSKIIYSEDVQCNQPFKKSCDEAVVGEGEHNSENN